MTTITLKFDYTKHHKSMVEFTEQSNSRLLAKLYLRGSELPEGFDLESPIELTIKNGAAKVAPVKKAKVADKAA